MTGSATALGYGNTWKTKQASKSPTYKSFTGHLDQAMQMTGFPDSWIPGMIELVGRESSWNYKADNPTSTAYGYGQFLDSTRANYKKKLPKYDYNVPSHQLVLMMHYVKDRYGDPYKALKFWDNNKWY